MASLFGRNLSLLASSLQGRTQYEFPLFRSRNHLTLFSIAMGLLELARYLFSSVGFAQVDIKGTVSRVKVFFQDYQF
jgi:hypothetical protein